MELVSSDLRARTELLDADRADGKLPSCNKVGEVKEVSACKPGPVKKAINFTQNGPPH